MDFNIEITPPAATVPPPNPGLSMETILQLRELRRILAATNGLEIHALSPQAMLRLCPHYQALALISDRGVFYDDRLHANPEQLLHTLAHEVGHALDFRTNILQKKLIDAYWYLYGPWWFHWPADARQMVFDGEVRAWDFSEHLIERLGLSIGLTYRREQVFKSLAIYRKILRLDE